jgi:hypothetical protein
MKRNRIIKLSEDQLRRLMNEAPFSYLGNSTSDTNHQSTVTDNIPKDNPGIEPEPIKADKVSHTLSNNSWWNRHYGFNGYSL